jgi:hypothetical protein
MSLINDALKRATQAQPATKPAPEMETTMKPAPPPRTVGLPVYFMPVLLFIISGACWFLVKGWDARRPSGTAAKPLSVQARELPESPGLPAGEGAELPIPKNRQFALNDTPTPVAGTAAEATGSTPAAGATAVEGFRLQGIFYRPNNPSAVVNSRTVFVGDRIANAQVKAIDQRSVTLDCAGEIKVLTLH